MGEDQLMAFDRSVRQAMVMTAFLFQALIIFWGPASILAQEPSNDSSALVSEDTEPNWSGTFRNSSDNKTLNIGNYGNNDLGVGNFSFFFSEMGGQEFDGVAAAEDENPRTAEYMDLRFVLSHNDDSVAVTMADRLSDADEREIFVDVYSRTDN